MTHAVFFTARAEADLLDIFDFIALRDGPVRARDYCTKLRQFCLSLHLYPERGTLRADLRPGLRILGYRRQASIAIRVTKTRVHILAIYQAGRDIR